MSGVGRARSTDCTACGDAEATAAPGLAGWLCLAATPGFAGMALLAGAAGGGPMDALCAAGHGFALGGMVPMYLLMSVFHASPWLRLMPGRRCTSSGQDRWESADANRTARGNQGVEGR